MTNCIWMLGYAEKTMLGLVPRCTAVQQRFESTGRAGAGNDLRMLQNMMGKGGSAPGGSKAQLRLGTAWDLVWWLVVPRFSSQSTGPGVNTQKD